MTFLRDRQDVSPQLLGPGIPTVRARGGYLTPKRDFDAAWSNILFILGTLPGERLMNRRFGSRASEMLFDPNDTILASRLKRAIRDAIQTYEPRVLIEKLAVTANEQVVQIRFEFSLRGELGSTRRGVGVARGSGFRIVNQF